MTTPQDRYTSIAMALRLYRLIRQRPMTLADLAAALDVHERTVRRLIEALVAADVTIGARRRGESLAYHYRAAPIR